MHSLPPSIETEIRDTMSTRTIPPPETTYLPSSNRSPAMSGVAQKSSAVADLTHELERQIAIAEHEKQQEPRQIRQLETVRQEAASVLHPTTQSLTESHRNEATAAIAYVSNLTENAVNRLNGQSQKLQQMADNGERLDARPRQMITARKNQLRNQATEESPERAKPKAKSEPKAKTEPFKLTSTAVKDDEVKGESDDENPETNHEPKGKRGRPSIIKRTIGKRKNPTMTPKRTKTEPTHIGEKPTDNI